MNGVKRAREPFDPARASPESLVSYRDIADYASLSPGHLRNLRHQGKFIEPEVAKGNYTRFRWSKAKTWADNRS